MRKAGLSNLFVRQSVSRLSVCQAKKLKCCHMDPHKPSKGSEMTARKQCFLTIYVLHRHRGYCFGCFFQLFPIIRNVWPHLFSFAILYTVSGHSHTLDMAIHEHSIRDSTCSMQDVTSIVAPVGVPRGMCVL